MTPLQGRIFWALRRGPPEGMSGDDLFEIAYSDQFVRMWNHKGRSREALKAHVSMLRQELADYGIIGSKCRGGWYRLVKKHDVPMVASKRWNKVRLTPRR